MQTSNPKPLAGKVAIVTGATASNSMGHAASMAMANWGASIVVTGLAEERPELDSFHKAGSSWSEIESRVAEIKALGVDAIGLHCDVMNHDDIKKVVREARESFGGIDILFNNAGVPMGWGPFLEIPENAWDIQYGITVKGPAHFIQEVVPVMKERGGGSIINNSSNWALKPKPFHTSYVATKAGMIALTKAAAIEFGEFNIRVNAICPGTVLSAMNVARAAMVEKTEGRSAEEYRAEVAKGIALRRLGQPEEIGNVVAFLASPLASWITGVALPVDGGFLEGL